MMTPREASHLNLITYARGLVRRTLLDMGRRSIPLEWSRCPACGTKEWKHLSAFTNLEEVCYPCGLLAMIAAAEEYGDEDAVKDYTERYAFAFESLESFRKSYIGSHLLMSGAL